MSTFIASRTTCITLSPRNMFEHFCHKIPSAHHFRTINTLNWRTSFNDFLLQLCYMAVSLSFFLSFGINGFLFSQNCRIFVGFHFYPSTEQMIVIYLNVIICIIWINWKQKNELCQTLTLMLTFSEWNPVCLHQYGKRRDGEGSEHDGLQTVSGSINHRFTSKD